MERFYKLLSGFALLGIIVLAGCDKPSSKKTAEEKVEKAEPTNTEPEVKFEILVGEINSDNPTPGGVTIIGIHEDSQIESSTATDGGFSLSVPEGSERPRHILAWSQDFQYVGEQAFADGGAPENFALSMSKLDSIPGSVTNLVSGEAATDASVMFWFGQRDKMEYSSITTTGSGGEFSLPSISGIKMFARAFQGDLISRVVEVTPGEKLELGLLKEIAPLVRFHDPSGKVEFPIVVSFKSSTGDIFLLETDSNGVIDLLGTPRGEIYLLDFPSIDFVAQPPVLQTWTGSGVLLVPEP